MKKRNEIEKERKEKKKDDSRFLFLEKEVVFFVPRYILGTSARGISIGARNAVQANLESINKTNEKVPGVTKVKANEGYWNWKRKTARTPVLRVLADGRVHRGSCVQAKLRKPKALTWNQRKEKVKWGAVVSVGTRLVRSRTGHSTAWNLLRSTSRQGKSPRPETTALARPRLRKYVGIRAATKITERKTIEVDTLFLYRSLSRVAMLFYLYTLALSANTRAHTAGH